MSDSYAKFLEEKSQLGGKHGFEPTFLPDCMFDFQRALVTWATVKGRSAILADCGTGKSLMQLVWAENVVRKTNRPVLIATPLAVAHQTQREGEKFGIESHVSRDGKGIYGIVITNYEKLHLFKASDFAGMVCDEASILKCFDGKTKAAITEFMRLLPYRLLCSASMAPNDYIELGTASEALGEMGYLDMLSRFFKADAGGHAHGGRGMSRFDKNPFESKFRFRGHSEHDFWRWVCSWARAIRKPSDLGFDDGPFSLPPLTMRQHVVEAATLEDGFLFAVPAVGLAAQRKERRNTLAERCEKAAALVETDKPALVWCNLNDEAALLDKLIPDAVEIGGADSDEAKEEAFAAFCDGKVRVLISKAQIAGLGLNFQHCAHQTFFPSHSFEQWYQSVRRSWRFGQKNEVVIDMVTSEGEAKVLANLQRKAKQAEIMFSSLVRLMNDELSIQQGNPFNTKQNLPSWLN